MSNHRRQQSLADLLGHAAVRVNINEFDLPVDNAAIPAMARAFMPEKRKGVSFNDLDKFSEIAA